MVSSFYNKFPKIMYNSEHVQKLKMWLDYPDKNIKPPPLKNIGGHCQTMESVL